MKPAKVTDVDLAFGGNMKELLPPYNDIPEQFKLGNTKWNTIVSTWFFYGLPGETGFHEKEGIDCRDALRHIIAILKSFEPQHEHKEAGAAYLLSEWFESVEIPEVAR